jgi:hypothetical protein
MRFLAPFFTCAVSEQVPCFLAQRRAGSFATCLLLINLFAQQLRQLGDVRRDPPRLVFREQLGRPTGGYSLRATRRGGGVRAWP